MASQITGVWIVCPTICSGADERKHQSSESLAFVRGIHRWPVDSPHKGPVTRKMLPFDDVIMRYSIAPLWGRGMECLCSSYSHLYPALAIGTLYVTYCKTRSCYREVPHYHTYHGCEMVLPWKTPAFKIWVNSSPPGKNARHFPDDIFKCIFMNEKFCILIQISLKFVPKGPINNIPALVEIMAWRQPCNKPLSEPMLTQFTDASWYATLGGDEWS